MVDTKKDIIKRDILKRLLLKSTKLEKMTSEDDFNPIDLRNNTTIKIIAEQFKQLPKIKNITIYPKFCKRDEDYKVDIEEDTQSAVLTILAVKKFKTGRVIISIK